MTSALHIPQNFEAFCRSALTFVGRAETISASSERSMENTSAIEAPTDLSGILPEPVCVPACTVESLSAELHNAA